jgi:hypothetical protein
LIVSCTPTTSIAVIFSCACREAQLKLRDLVLEVQDRNLATGNSRAFRYKEQVVKDYFTVAYLLSGTYSIQAGAALPPRQVRGLTSISG